MRKDLAGPPGRTKAQNRATVQQLKLVRSFSCFVFSYVSNVLECGTEKEMRLQCILVGSMLFGKVQDRG